MRAINSIIFVVLITLNGCTNKVVIKKSVVKGSEKMAKTNVANLIKSDSDGSYLLCTELGASDANERNQMVNNCRITPLPSLFLQKKKGTDNYEIKEDTSFLISLVYKADSLIGTIKARRINNNYKVVSWSPLKKEDGSINGSSAILLMAFVTQNKSKIYTIRFNEEYFVYGYGDDNKMAVTSFAYGYIKRYKSVADWVKKTFN